MCLLIQHLVTSKLVPLHLSHVCVCVSIHVFACICVMHLHLLHVRVCVCAHVFVFLCVRSRMRPCVRVSVCALTHACLCVCNLHLSHHRVPTSLRPHIPAPIQHQNSCSRGPDREIRVVMARGICVGNVPWSGLHGTLHGRVHERSSLLVLPGLVGLPTAGERSVGYWGEY